MDNLTTLNNALAGKLTSNIGNATALNQLSKYGNVTVIKEENSCPDLTVNGRDLGFVKLPEGPNYSINIETDASGLKRLQEALKETTVSEAEIDKNMLKTMHDVKACKGETMADKVKSYLKKKDEQAEAVCNELAKTEPKKKSLSGKNYKTEAKITGRYKLRHR